MSDTDPRLDVLRGEWLEWANLLEGIERWKRLLAAFDAADRAAGIVRVDTRDEELIQATWWAVEKQFEDVLGGFVGDALGDILVRAVLAALREGSSDE
jgi:hypothetical protein